MSAEGNTSLDDASLWDPWRAATLRPRGVTLSTRPVGVTMLR
jgi:hypothetical protein